ncbi:DUF3152 domain-containing protein [Streptomyces pactum]|uniref:DUF3152 domain-containing protein n=1 Tax=Streptomyces pactum TaxID=68249 RepID=A0ABS0NNU0_9ACTN|nr:DUF3152 domain-containing protein [Streptomyces pactum]
MRRPPCRGPRTPGPAAPDAAGAGARTAGRPAGGRRRTVPGPRHEDVAAFDALDARLRGTPEPQAAGATAGVPGGGPAAPVSTASEGVAPPPAARSTTRSADGGGGGTRAAGPGRPGRGRAFTGVAAAAVTTVLAVVVAGQVSEGAQETHAGAQPQGRAGPRRLRRLPRTGPARPPPVPARPPAAPATYAEKMARKYPLDPRLAADGSFATIPGRDKAPGTGPVTRYRVDVERGLPLDGELFAEAVHRTLNDDRSWGHGGARTFERVSSGRADFVITLASPATTAKWCAKSGLDTTVDNVSCDSASTERVMINAYRWAQGAATYGDDKLHTYRQMLINHEVGHRLGRNHEFCSADGALAPVMMQQTKFLTTDGATCRINAWPYPTS